VIVDTSCVVAILMNESGSDELARRILHEDSSMSAASYVELMCVLARSKEPATALRADRLLEALGIAVVPVTTEQARIAAQAYRVFGRGTGHPAALNFGDVFAYALAVATNEALLFAGEDFAATDVLVAQA
jgi:ribonuclease VapC